MVGLDGIIIELGNNLKEDFNKNRVWVLVEVSVVFCLVFYYLYLLILFKLKVFF